RHAIVEEAHAELVIRLLSVGVDREEGEPDAPSGPFEQGAARRGRRVGAELAPDHRRDLDCILVGSAVEYLPRDKVLARAGRVDQQYRVGARKQHARLELQGLGLGLREFDNSAFARTVELRFAAYLLIDFAVARLFLIEPIPQPILRLPGDKA